MHLYVFVNFIFALLSIPLPLSRLPSQDIIFIELVSQEVAFERTQKREIVVFAHKFLIRPVSFLIVNNDIRR